MKGMAVKGGGGGVKENVLKGYLKAESSKKLSQLAKCLL